MADPIKDLYDAASAVESELSYLEETLLALDLHYEAIEGDGYQNEDSFEDWKAISFAKRFPMHHAALYLIRESFSQHLAALRAVDTAIYDTHFKNKKEETPNA